MGYITISELSEVIKENITGNEYLMITDENNNSTKIKMSTFAEYIGNVIITPMNTNKLEIISTDKILIENNKIHLPYKASGDIINNMALVYEDSSEVYTEYSCLCGEDGMSAIFDSSDNLNGKYATVSYLTAKDVL